MTHFEALRRQIHGVEELASIVHTMKSLAAVRVRQYERAASSLASFEATTELGFQALLRRMPLTELTPERRFDPHVAAIVVGTDQGMCGPFNDRLVAFAEHWIRSHPAEIGPVLVVGRRAADLLVGSRLAPADPGDPSGDPFGNALAVPTSLSAVTRLVEELLVRIDRWRAADRFARLVVFHHRRGRGTRSEPRVLQHLPLPATWLTELARRPWTGPSLPLVLGERGVLLSALIRQHLFGTLYRAVVESLESEHVSRLEAMQAAEANIAELLEDLRANQRQERQSSIMAELLDILSGYEVARDAHEPSSTAADLHRKRPRRGRRVGP